MAHLLSILKIYTADSFSQYKIYIADSFSQEVVFLIFEKELKYALLILSR